MKIKIKYNGRRFPRAVTLQGGKRTSFLENRLILELEEYDALFLLKHNSRLTPLTWDFTVTGIVFPKEEVKSTPPPVKEESPVEEKKGKEPEPKKEEKKEEKPAREKYKKSMST